MESREAVLLVGSGYASLKVAEDLAQSGIPVVWVTGSHHFLEFPSGAEDFVEHPLDLNFQFRPLYLRVTRHPLVTPLTRAMVESIKSDGKGGFKSTVIQNPRYIDYDLCTGCGKCIEICPLNENSIPPLSRTPSYCPSRAIEMDKRKISECRISCPLNVNVQAYAALTAVKRFDEALAVIRETNPLPAVCGRICHHPCEETCRRKEIDQPVAIRELKRFLAEYEPDEPAPLPPDTVPKRTEKIAVIGSGPAGLTAAHFLNMAGFPVTIFEALPEAGGMLRAGINSFRLPRKILDSEIQQIVRSGVEIKTGIKIRSAEELLKNGFRAVLFSAGAHGDLRLNIPGEDLPGIIHCAQFLRDLNIEGRGTAGPRVVIIGAGNSAMDSARAALRLGADEVTVLGIEKEDEMPAHPREAQEAREEGVKFILGAAPVAFEGDNKVQNVICRKAGWKFIDGRRILKYGSDDTFKIGADTVIVSIGQSPDLSGTQIGRELRTDRSGNILINSKYSTSEEGIFAAGDVVTGPLTVVDSMASGRLAAGYIMEYITGKPSPFESLKAGARGAGEYTVLPYIKKQNRPDTVRRSPDARRGDFDEISSGFTPEQAVAEAKRCLQCASCCECRVCETVCLDIGAIDHNRQTRKINIHGPAVLIADDNELGDLNTGNIEGIYRMDEYNKSRDLVILMLAGSSLAGHAMARARLMREPVTQKRPLPDLPDEQNIGVFTCTCNGTMAPPEALERIRETAGRIPQVKHSELIFSACHPRGADRISAACAEHKLTRIIVASCSCCPLEFQCISCNDQRTRVRMHLFDRLGLERSQFEMINLKDHLDNGNLSADEIVDKAHELLRGAYIRAKFIKQLIQGYTEIGNRILILGGSEIGLTCAMNLDLQGFSVTLAHKCRLMNEYDFPEEIKNRKILKDGNASITHVRDAVIIESVTGHVGNYTVAYKRNGKRGEWKTDIICLTDTNLIPLTIKEDRTGLKKFYRYNFSFFHSPQPGFYRILPKTVKKLTADGLGAALAAQVAKSAAESFLKDYELSPRVDTERCRGCGRCARICPFNAIKMVETQNGIYHSEVLRHNCVGCGGCVGRCPVTAMDMPYFSNLVLDETVAGALTGETDYAAG